MTRVRPAARTWLWLLLLGWLPVWALFTLLVSPANPIHARTPLGSAAASGLVAIVIAALLGLLVQRLADRVPWPHPFRPGFPAVHALAAVLFSSLWVVLNDAVELLLHRQSMASFHFLLLPSLVLGVWLYVMVAGVTYATKAAARAAQAEASAARSQLAALRGQLNPHFLFNALHTVVQLIPGEPEQAARAAEQLAGLLRTTLEEDRDLVTLAEERDFVERYLDLERIRFGERLRVRIATPAGADTDPIPCFALQTLVENAVRHGAAPRIEPTVIVIEGSVTPARLTLTVSDDGAGAPTGPVAGNGGTGLQRLRERLAVLYGDSARLELVSGSRGFSATLHLPRTGSEQAAGE